MASIVTCSDGLRRIEFSLTPPGAASKTTRENRGEVTLGQLCASGVGEGAWALQDSNL